MKIFFKSTIFLVALTAVLISCENESISLADSSMDVDTSELSRKFIDSLETSFTTNLMAGQHHNAGTVTITKDSSNLLVTYETNTDTSSTKNWTIKATHLYVGACDGMPTTKSGNPKIGKFPYKEDHEVGTTNYTYSIPLDKLDECFCVAAHAVVDCSTEITTTPTTPTIPVTDPDTLAKSDKGGNKDKGQADDSCGEETAWAEGQGFSGNSWAMFIEICDTTGPDPTVDPNPTIDPNPMQ